MCVCELHVTTVVLEQRKSYAMSVKSVVIWSPHIADITEAKEMCSVSSCTDALHILPSLSSHTNASSDGVCNFSNVEVKEVWEHPHSHLTTHRYASQHVSQCGSTHITTFQLAVIHHSNATSLSPILLSLQTPVSAHNSRNKRRFPSQHP